MIIENRSKNLQRFNFEDETIVLEIGNNELTSEKFQKLKSHNFYNLLINASILKVANLGITAAFEDVEPEVLKEELRTEDAIEIKIKKKK